MRNAATAVLGLAVACAGLQCSSEPDRPNAASSVLTERLATAALEGNHAAVEAMLPSVDINARDEAGRTLLMLAAYDGHSNTVRLLCENGANPNLKDANRRTALMYSASGPNAHTVEVLLAHGADLNAIDGEEGWTALMFAAAEGHADIVEMLLAKGAVPDMMDIDGESAAHFARANGHADVVALLDRAAAP